MKRTSALTTAVNHAASVVLATCYRSIFQLTDSSDDHDSTPDSAARPIVRPSVSGRIADRNCRIGQKPDSASRDELTTLWAYDPIVWGD